MSEERKIEAFSAHRTRNGGWLIVIRDDRLDRGAIAPEYAYSSDHDMLEALPRLIGVRDDRARERGKQWYLATTQQALAAGGYENGD